MNENFSIYINKSICDLIDEAEKTESEDKRSLLLLKCSLLGHLAWNDLTLSTMKKMLDMNIPIDFFCDI